MTNYEFDFHGKNKTASGQNVGLMTAWTYAENDVHINVEKMIEVAQRDNTTFEKVFSEAVSHEIIHSLVAKFDSAIFHLEKSLDAICSQKQTKEEGKVNFSTWCGGIPWPTDSRKRKEAK